MDTIKICLRTDNDGFVYAITKNTNGKRTWLDCFAIAEEQHVTVDYFWLRNETHETISRFRTDKIMCDITMEKIWLKQMYKYHPSQWGTIVLVSLATLDHDLSSCGNTTRS